MSLSLKGVREIFGRALKSKGTLAQMGQMRFAKQLGEMLPGSKIGLPGVGRETKAFKAASAYLGQRGFTATSNLGEASAVMSLERGAFSHGASTLRESKLTGKPVLRASRVEPAYGPMETVDKHAKVLTAADREIQYNNLYPKAVYSNNPLLVDFDQTLTTSSRYDDIFDRATKKWGKERGEIFYGKLAARDLRLGKLPEVNRSVIDRLKNHPGDKFIWTARSETERPFVEATLAKHGLTEEFAGQIYGRGAGGKVELAGEMFKGSKTITAIDDKAYNLENLRKRMPDTNVITMHPDEVVAAAKKAANPWEAETIPLSRREVNRSERVGGRRASDVRAVEQEEARAARGEDVWGNTQDVRRNPMEQDRAALKRQNARRNTELRTAHSMDHTPTPGRPVSNTVPVGGRIVGMQEGWWGQLKKAIGFGSPWRGILTIPKEIVGLYKNKLIKQALKGGRSWAEAKKATLGGLTVGGGGRNYIHGLSTQVSRENVALRKQIAKHARDIRSANRSGFSHVALLPEGSHSGSKLRGIIKHERVHQVRHMQEGAYGFYSREASLSEAATNRLQKMGYKSESFMEEAIAYGHEAEYLKGRGVATRSDLAGAVDDVIDFARKEGASSDIRPWIQKRPVKAAQMLEYKGFQQGTQRIPGFHLFNLTQDIPGHAAGSTVAEKTLAKHGIPYEHLIPQRNLAKMVEEDTIRIMDNLQSVQSHSTVPGLGTSLTESRGIRMGRQGGNG